MNLIDTWRKKIEKAFWRFLFSFLTFVASVVPEISRPGSDSPVKFDRLEARTSRRGRWRCCWDLDVVEESVEDGRQRVTNVTTKLPLDARRDRLHRQPVRVACNSTTSSRQLHVYNWNWNQTETLMRFGMQFCSDVVAEDKRPPTCPLWRYRNCIIIIIIVGNFFLGKLPSKNTKLRAEKYPFWVHLGAKLKFWVPVISSVGNLQLSVRKPPNVWPLNSPDLNPVEYCETFCKRRCKELHLKTWMTWNANLIPNGAELDHGIIASAIRQRQRRLMGLYGCSWRTLWTSYVNMLDRVVNNFLLYLNLFILHCFRKLPTLLKIIPLLFLRIAHCKVVA